MYIGNFVFINLNNIYICHSNTEKYQIIKELLEKYKFIVMFLS